jgi:two-component system OmpR family sensor kinase
VSRTHSLRARLLWFLLAAIVLTAIAQALSAYRTARAEADQIFDYHMQQMAMSLRPGLAANGEASGIGDDDVDFVVQVWSADGLRVYESTARAQLPQRAVLGFSDVQAHGTTYRVFSIQTRAQTIQVAQDMAVRRQMAGSLALRTLWPIAVMAPLLMLAVWWAVSSSLAPLARVRRQVSQRAAEDLSAIGSQDLPDEIRPLVDELNLLFARVRQAFDAQKNFVADAAHELRSPLAALKLQVQGLRRAGDDASREVSLARLNAGIDRATHLIEQLLVLARQQAVPERLQRVSLAGVAREAVSDAAQRAVQHGIDLGLGELAPGDIQGHAEALRILASNLVDNALKYTPAGGAVDVDVQRAGERLVLRVEDSGPGIPEHDRERVLDRFYRVPGAQATGSGLGLAIVKSIAQAHGATLALGRSTRRGGLLVEVGFGAESLSAER